MPYHWTDTAPEEFGAVSHQLKLWPYRSLPHRGFVWFIGITVTLLALPILAVLGTAALWGVLPFAGLAVWGVWFGIQRSYRSGESLEEMRFDARDLWLRRTDTGRAPREWHTNSYWVRPHLRNGPVESYLTLTDGKREIELGVFLTPEERRNLHQDLLRRLSSVR